MKRLFSMMVAFVLLVLTTLAIIIPVNGEHEPWDCPDCDRTGNKGNYCGECGYPAPWTDPDAWKDDTSEREAKLAAFRNVGSYVTFGSYEQDNNIANGQEPIEWLVLDYDTANNRALLLSRYGLDAHPYNTEFTNTTWEKCSLRAWLNGAFLNVAFSETDKASILLTNVDNSISQDSSNWSRWSSGEKDTQDKVFLLSYAEANRYLGVTIDNNSNARSRVAPTTFAIQQGAYISRLKTADGMMAGWWWLRSAYDSYPYTAYVHYYGTVDYHDITYTSGCVRPAIWISLETDLFSKTAIAVTTSPTSSGNEAKLALFCNVGSYVSFGSYEQDDNVANGPEPIEWIVLDYDEVNNRALLLSRYGLDAKPYNTVCVDITWEKSTMRTWLNGKFMNNAFSKAEQGAIVTTVLDNSKSQGYSRWDTNSGDNTQDKVFLLSYAEANKYIGVTWEDSNNLTSRVTPTAYALKQKAYTSGSSKTADGSAAGWWWLRSPGSSQENAACVLTDGSLHNIDVSNYYGCIRPALWINLEYDIF